MNYLLVEVFQEYEAGGGANDGGQAPDSSGVRYAQGEALADHLVVLGLVLLGEFLVPGPRAPHQGLFLQRKISGSLQPSWVVQHTKCEKQALGCSERL